MFSSGTERASHGFQRVAEDAAVALVERQAGASSVRSRTAQSL